MDCEYYGTVLREDGTGYHHSASCPATIRQDATTYTPEQILKAIYESGLHQYVPGVLTTVWKDGIDIDTPSTYLLHFVRKLQEL